MRKDSVSTAGARALMASGQFWYQIYAILVSFPIVCFVGALVTDISYWSTAEMMWANFSAWLLATGLVVGVLAAMAGVACLLSDRLLRRSAAGWYRAVGGAVVLLIALLNVLLHSRDAWTSVVPTGIALSFVTVLVMLVIPWLGGTMAYVPVQEK